MTKRLFIYGTLKRGQVSHHLLDDAVFVAEAVTKPVYRLLDLGNYPALVWVGSGGVAIQGELWAVPETGLKALDDYEGEDYERRPILLESGEMVETYLWRAERGGYPDAGVVWEKGGG